MSSTPNSLRVVRLSVFKDATRILNPDKDTLEGLLKSFGYGGITTYERVGPNQLRITFEKIHSVDHSCDQEKLSEWHEVKTVSNFSWGETLPPNEPISIELLNMLSFSLLKGSIVIGPGENACAFLKSELFENKTP